MIVLIGGQAITTRKADNVLKKTINLNKQKKPINFVLSNFLGQVQKSVVFLLLFSSINVILGVKHLFSALITAWFLIVL